MKYTADEARSLKKDGQLPDDAKINETDVRSGVVFGGLGLG
jgi:hypothetical protein